MCYSNAYLSPFLYHPPPLPAVVVCSPQVVLESAKSHVLEEPVPRMGRSDTLPWDCHLAEACVHTVGVAWHRCVLHPLSIKSSLAAQQEGLAVTVHLETVAMSLSRKQVCVCMYMRIVCDGMCWSKELYVCIKGAIT